ncbi:sigma-70 family RNA polymerase sigma factor [Planctomycetota bacterium]
MSRAFECYPDLEKTVDQSDGKMTEAAVYWTQVQFDVAGFVASLIPNYSDAEDVMQQVAVVAISKFDEFDQDRSFRDWVLGIARYEVLKYRERNAREKLIFCQALIDQIAAAYCRPERGTDQIYHALRQCLQAVKGRNRQALNQWYVKRAGAVQIAQELGISKNTLYVMLHRLRNSLRGCVERRLAATEEIS